MIFYYDMQGRITRTVTCPTEEASYNALQGEQWLESDSGYSPSSHYVEKDTFLSIPEKPSNHHEFDWTTKSWAVPSSALPNAIAQRQSEVNKLRDSKLYAPFAFQGVLFDCDSSSLQNMQGVMARIERGDGLTAGWIGWRTYDNSMVWANSSPEEVLSNLRSIASELENRKQSLLTTSWQHKEAIAALTSLEEILSYDTSQGWSV